jgi:hypothetical protein
MLRFIDMIIMTVEFDIVIVFYYYFDICMIFLIITGIYHALFLA